MFLVFSVVQHRVEWMLCFGHVIRASSPVRSILDRLWKNLDPQSHTARFFTFLPAFIHRQITSNAFQIDRNAVLPLPFPYVFIDCTWWWLVWSWVYCVWRLGYKDKYLMSKIAFLLFDCHIYSIRAFRL